MSNETNTAVETDHEREARELREDAKARFDAADVQVKVLSLFLGVDVDDIVEEGYAGGTYRVGRNRWYKVLTDEQADEACEEEIRANVWAFSPSFIASHAKPRLAQPAVLALREVQEKLCESANDLVLALIDDFDRFVQDAISADGRGHFLNPEDGSEHEIKFEGETYYIYG